MVITGQILTLDTYAQLLKIYELDPQLVYVGMTSVELHQLHQLRIWPYRSICIHTSQGRI